MSETMQLPGAVEVSRANGTTFQISLIAANRACSRIAEECDKAGLRNFEYAEKFAEWVRESTGGEVVLTPDEADFLFDWVQLEHSRKKKATTDELRRNWQSSTEPPPSCSDQASS